MVLCTFLKHKSFDFFFFFQFYFSSVRGADFKPTDRDMREGGREEETLYCERERTQRSVERVVVLYHQFKQSK